MVDGRNTAHKDVYKRQVVDNVSIKVHKGEVVGISGLMGAGRTELAMSIFGKSYGTNISGKLFINGEEVHLKNERDAIDHKLAYVTEDRKGNGLILSNPIKTNTTLANMAGVSSHGIIDKDKAVSYTYLDVYKRQIQNMCWRYGAKEKTGEQKSFCICLIRIRGREKKMYKIMLADDEGIVIDSLTFIIRQNFGENCEIASAKTGRSVIEPVSYTHLI